MAALVALAVSAFSFVTTEGLPVGLLQVIAANLKMSVSSAGLLVSVYAGVVVVVSAPLAHLTRHVPRRWLLSVLLAAFVLTTLAGTAAAGNYWLLLSAHVLTAIAQGLFWALVVKVRRRPVPPGRRAAKPWPGSRPAAHWRWSWASPPGHGSANREGGGCLSWS